MKNFPLMFAHSGKTNKIIGKKRISTYKRLYEHMSNLQDNGTVKVHENYFDKIAPMDNNLYIHNTEGKDDMPAHIKSALTNNQISLSLKNGKLLLGTWQGLYLFEHRLHPHNRTIIHHYVGD